MKQKQFLSTTTTTKSNKLVHKKQKRHFTNYIQSTSHIYTNQNLFMYNLKTNYIWFENAIY